MKRAKSAIRSMRRRRKARMAAPLATERLEPRQLLYGTPLGQFVNVGYEEVLHREAETDGLAFWSGALGAGTLDRYAFARELFTSPEHANDIVSNLYISLLDRAPSAGELEYWAAQIRAGVSELTVQTGFIASQEYYDLSATPPDPDTDTTFITSAYQDILERAPGQPELDFWTGELPSITRDAFANSIVYSTENLEQEVTKLYQQYLGRDPEAQGLEFWTNALRSGLTPVDLAVGFLGSPEYFTHVTVPALLVPGTEGANVRTTIRWGGETLLRNEVGYFITDGTRMVDSKLPIDPGYAEAVLTTESRHVIFTPDTAPTSTSTALDSLPFSETVDLPGEMYVGIYIVQNASADDVLNPGPSGPANVYFTFPAANTDGFSHFKYLNFVATGVEDLTGGGDQDFNDAVLLFDFPNAVITTPNNQAPVIDPIEDIFIPEQTLYTLQVTATDDGPTSALRYAIDAESMARGISIDAVTGALSWTPTEEQGPGSYSVTVRVTDAGVPALSGERSFTINVTESNGPPVLDPIANQTIPEETLLTVQASATDPDIPANQLVYSIDLASFNLGVRISQTTGLLTWTPTEAQGPTTINVTVRAADNGSPQRFSERTFTISVTEVNRSPVIDPIESREVDVGERIAFNVIASDPDLPANTLTYSLDPATTPDGATINPATGAFEWRPTSAHEGQAFTITVRVTDNGVPPLTATRQFIVNVLQCVFDTDLEAWTEFEFGGSESGRGNATIETMHATIVEGDSFLVGIQREYTLPAATSQLRFTIDELNFDETSSGEIRNAFEAALIDSEGRSIVLPFADGRDAFFNITDGLPAAFGPNVTFDGSTVVVDLTGVTVTNARLVFRLINNDDDVESFVALTCVKLEPIDVGPFQWLSGVYGPLPFVSSGDESLGGTGSGGSNGASQPNSGVGLPPPVGPLPEGQPSNNGVSGGAQLQSLVNIAALPIDSRGTDFWVGFADNLEEQGVPIKTLFIAGDIATTGTVTVPGLGFSQDFVVNPGSVTAVVLPDLTEVEAVGLIENLGIHIVSEDEVSVFGLNRSPATTDAFLAFPTDALGTEYINLGYRNTDRLLASLPGTQLLIVATEDDTEVTIHPGQYSVPTRESNVTLRDPNNIPILGISNGTDSSFLVTSKNGSYTLNITPPRDGYAGTYKFRLLDLETNSTPITINTAVTGSLPTGQETVVFNFQATSGQRFFIDGLMTSFQQTSARVVSPTGSFSIRSTCKTTRRHSSPLISQANTMWW